MLKEGWDPKAPVALAVADPGAALQFQNLCAILKVTIPMNGELFSEDFYVTVSANQDLAGTFDLNTADGTLTATAGSKTVTTGNSIILFGKRVIYLAIAPGAYTGFKCRAEYDENSEVYASKTKDSVTFSAGTVYDLGEFNPTDERE